jgi:cell division protein FtsL
MTSIAQGAPVGAREGRRSRTRAAGKQRLLGGGVLWIVLFAGLLAGVVAVNVAVLRLNLQLDGVGREHTQLKADLARLRSDLSSAAATERITRKARADGLVPADPSTTVYVQLPAKSTK